MALGKKGLKMKSHGHVILMIVVSTIVLTRGTEVHQMTDSEIVVPYRIGLGQPLPTYQPTGVGSGNLNRCSLCRMFGIQECIDRFCQTVEIVVAV